MIRDTVIDGKGRKRYILMLKVVDVKIVPDRKPSGARSRDKGFRIRGCDFSRANKIS